MQLAKSSYFSDCEDQESEQHSQLLKLMTGLEKFPRKENLK